MVSPNSRRSRQPVQAGLALLSLPFLTCDPWRGGRVAPVLRQDLAECPARGGWPSVLPTPGAAGGDGMRGQTVAPQGPEEVRCWCGWLRVFQSLGVFLAAGMVSACGAERPAGQWTVDTLPGGAVVVSNTGPGLWRGQAPWRLVEEVKIGTRDGSGPDAFGSVRGLEVDPLGRVYVLDFQAHEIRVFNRDGAFVRTIGRRGGGPGEFAAPQGLMFDPSSRLWVNNMRNLRYSVFDTSGALVTEFRKPSFGQTWLAGWDAVFDRSGALWDAFLVESGTERVVRRARYDTATGTYVDTLVSVGFPRAPFGWAVRRGTLDGWWAGSAVEYRILKVTLRGDTLRVIERPDYQPIGQPGMDDAVLGDMPEALRQQAREQLRQQLSRLPQEHQPPDHLPVFHNFIEDEEGYLWVVRSREEGASSTPLDVFDPSGRYLGVVHASYPLERNPDPLVRGGRLYAVTKDDADVPYLVVMRIVGRN
jgi:hypothetical protein